MAGMRIVAAAALLTGAAMAQAPAKPSPRSFTVPALMNPEAVGKLPADAPVATIRYGEAESQFAELFLPDAAKFGAGPYPVVALIHGGCWRKSVAGIEMMRPAATDLAKRGYAVWSLTYRRIDEPGGGYPGTYADVAAALAKLAEEAPARKLDLGRVALAGHSAGGHLALWAAARGKLPAGHPARVGEAFPAQVAISLGGFGDFEAWGDKIDGVCGPGTLAGVQGEKSDTRPDVNADTSPMAMLPTPTPLVMVQGIYDGVSFPEIGRSFVRRAQNRGQNAALALVPNAGHFEIVAPGARPWETVVGVLAERLTPAAPAQP